MHVTAAAGAHAFELLLLAFKWHCATEFSPPTEPIIALSPALATRERKCGDITLGLVGTVLLADDSRPRGAISGAPGIFVQFARMHRQSGEEGAQ